MTQDTPQGKQVMGTGDDHETRPNDDMVVVHIGDKTTVGARTTAESEEKMPADDTQGDHSTVSTEWSRDKGVSSVHPSLNLEAETDPTSIPSDIFDDLDLYRKRTELPSQIDQTPYEPDLVRPQNTESPFNSIEAVHGLDSDRSEKSGSITGDSDSREGVPIAVNPGKVKAIGYHFGESSTATPASRFHDPTDSWEAQHINNKLQQVHDAMDDIDLHPEKRFRDQGTSFQLSARPKKESADPAFGEEGDIVPVRKEHFPPDSLPHFEIEEGHHIEGPRRRKLPRCIIL